MVEEIRLSGPGRAIGFLRIEEISRCTSRTEPVPAGAGGPALLVALVRVHRLLDIAEQDAEAEGVGHFLEQGHRGGSFKRVGGADGAARVCSIYGSSRHAFRAPGEGPYGHAAWVRTLSAPGGADA